MHTKERKIRQNLEECWVYPEQLLNFFQIGYNRWIQKRRWSSENVIEKKNEFNFMVYREKKLDS